MVVQKLQPAALLLEPGEPGPVSKGVPGRRRSRPRQVFDPIDRVLQLAQPLQVQQLLDEPQRRRQDRK